MYRYYQAGNVPRVSAPPGTFNLQKELWNAISDKNLKKVHQILSAGSIDLNEPYKTELGTKTYLQQACASSSPAVVCALVKAGANVDTCDNICEVNGSKYSATALIRAIIDRNEELVEKLLHRCDADVNATNNEGKAPLHFITGKGEQIPSLLLMAGARVDLRDDNGQTPLYIAVKDFDVSTAKILLQHGARADIPNRLGWTPLHISISKCHYEMSKLLIQETTADISSVVNHAKEDGTTPLHAVINDLVRMSKDYNNVNNERLTHTIEETETVVKLLIEKGADLEAKKHHLTPLHLAADGGLFNVVKLLVEAGADIHAETPNTGLTPLDMAEHGGKQDIIDYLTAKQESDGKKNKQEGAVGLCEAFMKCWSSRNFCSRCASRNPSDYEYDTDS